MIPTPVEPTAQDINNAPIEPIVDEVVEEPTASEVAAAECFGDRCQRSGGEERSVAANS